MVNKRTTVTEFEDLNIFVVLDISITINPIVRFVFTSLPLALLFKLTAHHLSSNHESENNLW